MREFGSSLDRNLKAGIYHRERNNRNSNMLEKCHGLRSTEHGLYKPHDLHGMTLPEAASWPFPNLHMGWQGNNILMYDDTMYTVNPSDLSTTPISFKDAEFTDPNSIGAGTISGSAPWHVAEQGNQWVATNGTSLVFPSAHMSRKIGTRQVFVGKNKAVINTVCQYGSTFYFGGFMPSPDDWYNSTFFTEIFQTWMEHTDNYTEEYDGIGPEWVMYSNMPWVDTEYPLAVELAILGYPQDTTNDELKHIAIEAVKDGRIGFLRLGSGTVNKILPKPDNSCLVFTTNNTAEIRNSGPESGKEPVSIGINSIGSQSRGACGGIQTTSGVAYTTINGDGKIYLYTLDGVQEVDARHVTTLLNGTVANYICTYNAEEKEIYISDGAMTICLRLVNGVAISTFDLCYSAVERNLGSNVYLGVDNSDGSFEVITTSFDYNQLGLKTIRYIQVDTYDVTDLGFTVYFRYQHEDDTQWRSKAGGKVGDTGASHFTVAGKEFKVGITGTIGTFCEVLYAYTRWCFNDKRTIRGIHNNQANEQQALGQYQERP